MAARGRAPAMLDDLLLASESASDSDADTYDEAIDIASLAGSIFSPDYDTESSEDNISDAPRPRPGVEVAQRPPTAPPKSRGQKRHFTASEATSTPPRPIDGCTFPDAHINTPRRRNTANTSEGDGKPPARRKEPFPFSTAATNPCDSSGGQGQAEGRPPENTTATARERGCGDPSEADPTRNGDDNNDVIDLGR